MKVGAENSKKTLVAVGLFVVALFLTFRMLSGGFSSSAAVPAPAVTAPSQSAPSPARRSNRRPARGANTRTANATPATPSLDPRLKLDALRQIENIEYSGNGRNIFMAQNEPIPQPIAPVRPQPTPTPTPVNVTPPPPPPIPLRFFGIANPQGGSRKVLLASGDGDVFVASEGEIVQRRYKIVKVNPNNIEVQDVLNNNVQTIPLTIG